MEAVGGLAAKKPVLRNLAPILLGQSSGDQAYRCHIVFWVEPGYSDPGFLLVSRVYGKPSGCPVS
ncbi:MAG TPA: hypothetical protein DD856_12110 [Sulfobacillus sp.]|nr:hypothetical protein [Sulfobacillus sp.]